MTRDEALKLLDEIKAGRDRYSLSDEYLEDRGAITRKQVGLGGDYCYGIFMIPEDTVIAMCEALMEVGQ